MNVYGNYIDESRMVIYPAHMVLSIPQGWILSFQVEKLFAELVRGLTDSLCGSDSSGKTPVPATLDLEDVRQSHLGDPDAYRRLVERHQEHVGRLMWRFSRDLRVHEELVQDVFVEAYISLSSYGGKAPFVHWLSRLATRVGYRYWKRTARRRTIESFTLQEWDRLPGESLEKMEPAQAAVLVHQLLAQLPPRDRLVLTLRYLEECDVAETARRTGWTQAMVKVQTWRARKKLRKLLRQSGKEII